MPLALRNSDPLVTVVEATTNLTLSASSNAWADVDTSGSASSRNLDLVFPNAVVGRKIIVHPNFLVGSSGAVVALLDIFTVVAGAPVHQFGTDASGITGWWVPSSTGLWVSASRSYTIAADDIENGSVRCRLRSKINHAATTRTISCSVGFQFVLEGRGPLG